MGKVKHCGKEMSFLLLFCHQDGKSPPSNLPLILSFHLFGSNHGPQTAADLFNDVKEKSRRSPIAVLTVKSSICRDLYIARALCVCVRVCVSACLCVCLCVCFGGRGWAHVPVLKICLQKPLFPFSPAQVPHTPASLCYGRSTHIRLKVYTLISSTNPGS